MTFLGMKSSEKEQPSLPFGLWKSRQKLRPQVVCRSRACPRAERDNCSPGGKGRPANAANRSSSEVV